MQKQTQTIFLVLLMAAVAVNFIPIYATEAQSRPQSVMINVQNISQAPWGEWQDTRQAEGCEEASIVMAMAWARGGGNVPPDEARRDIINMSEYERVIFGFFEDTSAQDTARVMQDIYQYKDVMVKEGISSEDIKQELAANRLVIFPLNTRMTELPLYRYGPIRHTIIAVGYDDSTNMIAVHDPIHPEQGNLWIPAANIDKALWNYLSGPRIGLGERRTALISVGKQL